VQLIGVEMVRLVGAIPRVQEVLGPAVIVGGLAVMARLGTAHRATSDLDTLRRRAVGDPTGLEVLRSAATEMDEVGGELTTSRGPVRVDVLELGPHDLDRDFSDPTDRLEAMAHNWALSTATSLRLAAASEADQSKAVVLMARPGPLIAMKLKAAVDRQDAPRTCPARRYSAQPNVDRRRDGPTQAMASTSRRAWSTSDMTCSGRCPMGGSSSRWSRVRMAVRLATESFDSPVVCAGRNTCPGVSAQAVFEVRTATTVVASLLALS
jgi:hypothetical protein